MSANPLRPWGALVLSMIVGLPARAEASHPEAPSPSERDAATIRRGDAYFHLMSARLAAGRGDSPEMQREIRQAIALAPEAPGLHAEAARLLSALGRREEAERSARRALELEPDEPRAMRILADLLASRALRSSPDVAARAEAIRIYEKLAEVPGADAQVLQILTNLKLLDDDLTGAVNSARRFAERRPGDPAAARLLTQLLLQQGKPQEALGTVLGYLSRNPDAADLVLIALDLASRTDRWPDVEATAKEMVAARPEAVVARILLGEALIRVGKHHEAVAVLEKAVAPAHDARTTDENARSLLGEAYLRAARYEDAVVQLEKVLEQSPAEALVRLHLASAYEMLGRLADASALAKGLAGDFPGNPAVLALLGESLSQQGLTDSAIEAFRAAREAVEGSDEQAAIRRDDLRLRVALVQIGKRNLVDAEHTLLRLERPERAEASKVLARVAVSQGRFRQARQIARKLRERGDPGIAALVEGEALLREEELSKAATKFDEAIAVLGEDSRDRVATICREAGHPQIGGRMLEEWVAREPANAEAQFALGRYLEREARFTEAEASLRRSLDLDPNNSQALNYLAYSLADRNQKLDEALTLVRRALEIDRWNGAYLDSLGWVYFRMGQYEKARDPLERAAREYPRDSTVLEHLGDLYEKLGDHQGAEAAWKRALEADPESANAEALRGKIRRDAASRGSRDRTSTLSPREAGSPASAPDPR